MSPQDALQIPYVEKELEKQKKNRTTGLSKKSENITVETNFELIKQLQKTIEHQHGAIRYLLTHSKNFQDAIQSIENQKEEI